MNFKKLLNNLPMKNKDKVTTDGLSFEQWLLVLKSVLIEQYDFRRKAANKYVGDGSDWKDYYEEDYSPSDAAAEDASDE